MDVVMFRRPPAHSDEGAARVAAAQAALHRLDQLAVAPAQDPAHDAAAARLREVYGRRIDSGATGHDGEEAGREAAVARDLRLRALAAERDELYRLRRSGALDDEIHRRLVRELDLLETSLLSGAGGG